MHNAEHAPLVSEDPELGVFIQEEVPDVQRPSRSKSFLRTVAAVFVIGAVAAVVVTGPIDNPLHADMGKVQQDSMWGGGWSLGSHLSSAAGKISSAADYATEHASSAYDSTKSLGYKLTGWTQGQADEHLAKLTDRFDSHFSKETSAVRAMSIQTFRGAEKYAQQEAQAKFCTLKDSYGFKSRLSQKMRRDFADTTSACAADFRSQACRDFCVADACSSAGAGLTAELCKITLDRVVQNIQDNMSASLVVAQQNSAILAGPGGALETNINEQMGAVDKELAQVCN